MTKFIVVTIGFCLTVSSCAFLDGLFGTGDDATDTLREELAAKGAEIAALEAEVVKLSEFLKQAKDDIKEADLNAARDSLSAIWEAVKKARAEYAGLEARIEDEAGYTGTEAALFAAGGAGAGALAAKYPIVQPIWALLAAFYQGLRKKQKKEKAKK
jgi:hypothetical protein